MPFNLNPPAHKGISTQVSGDIPPWAILLAAVWQREIHARRGIGGRITFRIGAKGGSRALARLPFYQEIPRDAVPVLYWIVPGQFA